MGICSVSIKEINRNAHMIKSTEPTSLAMSYGNQQKCTKDKFNRTTSLAMGISSVQQINTSNGTG